MNGKKHRHMVILFCGNVKHFAIRNVKGRNIAEKHGIISKIRLRMNNDNRIRKTGKDVTDGNA